MLFVTIGAHVEYSRTVIQSLHESGLVEIHPVPEEEDEQVLRVGAKMPETAACATYRLRLDRILGVLQEREGPGRPSIRELIFPPVPVQVPMPSRSFSEFAAEVENLNRRGDRTLIIQRELAELRNALSDLEQDIRAAALLVPLDVRPEHLGTSTYLYITAGTIPGEEIAPLARGIRDIGIDELILITRNAGRETGMVAIATLREYESAVAEELGRHAFQPIAAPRLTATPEDVLRRLTADRDRIRREINDRLQELGQMADELELPLLSYREELDVLHEEGESAASMGNTQEVVVIQGYIRASEREQLEKLVESTSEGHAFCRFRDPDPINDSIPVAYDNPWWARPFEMLTTLFARPRYQEIDPTVIIAVIIVFFFGLMLGDAGYGLILSVMALLLYRGVGRLSRTFHDLSLILIACGVSGIIFGVLQGSYFGDALQRFLSIQPPFVLVDPLQQPVDILLFALAIGVLQINFGLALAFYQNVRSHRYRESLTGQAVWFLLQPAAAVLLLDFFGWGAFPAPVMILAVAGAAAAVAVIFLDRGPLGFFGITGFLGDWLSYPRLLALDLATLGIALTINILTGMIAGIHPALVIAAVLFFSIAHLLNVVLQSLGGMIHSLRLQYVEFFGKFYSGGGRGFAPFSSGRIYTIRTGGERRQ